MAEENPHLILWKAALRIYLDDALLCYEFKQAGKPIPRQRDELEEAYKDLTGCGRILARLCDKTGHDPEYLRDLFKKAIGRGMFACKH